MKSLKLGVLLVFLSLQLVSMGQLFTVNNDSSHFALTPAGASHLARLPMGCILKEFPNKTNHTSANITDHVKSPKTLHPAFYGCFDWHSCVHGHWMLVKLLKLYPTLPEAATIKKLLNTTLTANNIVKEAAYFETPLNKIWERTYGWAWLLQLDMELAGWNDKEAQQWHKNLQPLTKKIVSLWMDFLPKQTYPNRTGVHPNTAFGLVFALNYARSSGNITFENAIVAAAKNIFAADEAAPVKWEPNGADFLSPALEEADLMRRVLPASEFITWRDKFLSFSDLEHLSRLPVVSDRNDYQIVHLDGLCFSRSWCMQGLALTYPEGSPSRKLLQKAAIHHLSTALPHIVSGSYGGEHWLASFAVYTLTQDAP